MKVAVALVVKDEASDILPWLCWYFNLNASTIIVYDDASRDGTYELVRDVSAVKDLRLHRITQSLELYTHRQQRCYIRTFAEYADEFDWIGFFDADEYLALPDGQDLLSFLDRPPEVGAVAINWCNYGSSGHVLKPRMPPFYAYNQHYPRGDAVNRHVKSFVRPKKWTEAWHNPHFFEVRPSGYVDPVGRPVSWSQTLGITETEAAWSGGKLMHYQCRSMEHFVERIRKRPDILAHPSLWASYDHGEVEDNTPRGQYEAVALIMYSVARGTISRVIGALSDDHRQAAARRISKPNFGDRVFTRSQDSETLPAPGQIGRDATVLDGEEILRVDVCQVVTCFRTTLSISGASVRVDGRGRDLTIGEQAIRAIRIYSMPQLVFFMSASDRKTPLIIEDDPRVVDVLGYECVPLEGGDLKALRHPSTGMLLSCEPPEIGGKLLASRTLVREWEKFSLAKNSSGDGALDADRRLILIQQFSVYRKGLGQFLSEHYDTDLDVLCSIFPILVHIARPDEREKALVMCGVAARYIF